MAIRYDCDKRNSSCGCAFKNVEINEKNNNPEEAIPYSWSMMVSIRYDCYRTGNPLTHCCSGTILNDRYILTAAHCFDSKDNSSLISGNITIAAGIHNLSQSCQTIRVVDQLFIHPDWTPPDEVKHNIAILRLSEPLDFNSDFIISQACFPSRMNTSVEITDNTNLAVVGWNFFSNSDDNKYKVLQQLIVHPIDYNDSFCAKSVNDSKLLFCTGRKEAPCFPKIGAGLFQWIGDRWELVGIESHVGDDCPQIAYKGLFVRVAAYNDWIESISNPDSITTPSTITTSVKPSFTYECNRTTACGCGYSDVVFRPTRIVGGQDVIDSSWSMIVSLRFYGSEEHSCAGTLLSSSFVLTAAHCIEHFTSTQSINITIRAGITSRLDPNGYQRNVVDIYIHPNYTSWPHFLNNIALLQLDRPLSFGNNPILAKTCVHRTNSSISIHEQHPKNATRLAVIGWGAMQSGSFILSEQLKQIQVNAIDSQDQICKDTISNSELQFCAGLYNGEKDACLGDSGGPILYWTGHYWEQVGIISYNFHCGRPEYPGIYTRLSYYWEWMEKILNEKKEHLEPQNPSPFPTTTTTSRPTITRTTTQRTTSTSTTLSESTTTTISIQPITTTTTSSSQTTTTPNIGSVTTTTGTSQITTTSMQPVTMTATSSSQTTTTPSIGSVTTTTGTSQITTTSMQPVTMTTTSSSQTTTTPSIGSVTTTTGTSQITTTSMQPVTMTTTSSSQTATTTSSSQTATTTSSSQTATTTSSSQTATTTSSSQTATTTSSSQTATTTSSSQTATTTSSSQTATTTSSSQTATTTSIRPVTTTTGTSQIATNTTSNSQTTTTTTTTSIRPVTITIGTSQITTTSMQPITTTTTSSSQTTTTPNIGSVTTTTGTSQITTTSMQPITTTTTSSSQTTTTTSIQPVTTTTGTSQITTTTTSSSQTTTTTTSIRPVTMTTGTSQITTTSMRLITTTTTSSSQTSTSTSKLQTTTTTVIPQTTTTMTTTLLSSQDTTTTIVPFKEETYECSRSPNECGCSLTNVVLSHGNQQLSSTNRTGEDAYPYSWSMIVSIRVNGTKHTCTGTILSESFILTAAHCVANQSRSSRILVAAGIHSLSQYVASIRRVDQVYIHESYTNIMPYLHDIAILHLEQPLELKTQPIFSKICLSNIKSLDSMGASFLVSVGWKHSKIAETEDNTVQQVSVKSITNPNSTCFNSIYNDTYQFCAGLILNDSGTCKEKFGEPVFVYRNKYWEQVGILSNAHDCIPTGHSGVYTRLSTYTSWIQRIMKDAAIPTRPPLRNSSALKLKQNILMLSILLFSIKTFY